MIVLVLVVVSVPVAVEGMVGPVLLCVGVARSLPADGARGGAVGEEEEQQQRQEAQEPRPKEPLRGLLGPSPHNDAGHHPALPSLALSFPVTPSVETRKTISLSRRLSKAQPSLKGSLRSAAGSPSPSPVGK